MLLSLVVLGWWGTVCWCMYRAEGLSILCFLRLGNGGSFRMS